MKQFGGPVLFLDRSDINTDEIIPAKYLNEIRKEDLKPYLLEDLQLPGFDPTAEQVKKARVIVTRANFGCGSSREHAPWVLEVNQINTVIAESFARIFRQNMYNCGMLAIELAPEQIEQLFSFAHLPVVELEVLWAEQQLVIKAGQQQQRIDFKLDDFARALIEAGGWVEWADRKY